MAELSSLKNIGKEEMRQDCETKANHFRWVCQVKCVSFLIFYGDRKIRSPFLRFAHISNKRLLDGQAEQMINFQAECLYHYPPEPFEGQRYNSSDVLSLSSSHDSIHPLLPVHGVSAGNRSISGIYGRR